MTPSVRLGYEYHDNLQLTLAPHDSISGTNISPRLDAGVRSEIWGVTGFAAFTRARYSDEQVTDQDSESVGISSSYRTERNNYAISVSRVNDTTFPDEVRDPDLGRVTVQRSRRTETVQPTWSRSLTERSRLQLSYQTSDTSYTGGDEISLFDYQQRSASATWSYLLSPRSQFFLIANHSRFRTPVISLQSQIPSAGAGILALASDVDSRSPGFRIGIGHEFSESLQGTLMIGQRRTTADRTVQDCLFNAGQIVACVNPRTVRTRDSGTTFSGDMKKQFDKFSVTASASRDIAASGAGSEIEWDTLVVQIDRPFTARLTGMVSINGSQSRRITEVVSTTTDIKQYSVQPGLRWQWTRQADLNASYRYLHVERENEDRAVHSRAFFLAFSYAWDPYSFSR